MLGDSVWLGLTPTVASLCSQNVGDDLRPCVLEVHAKPTRILAVGARTSGIFAEYFVLSINFVDTGFLKVPG